MNRFYIFLIAIVCSPGVGFAQDHDESTKDRLRVIKPENRTAADSILSESMSKHTGDRMFDTYPMPNAYRRDYAVAMPNAYRGDNCVPMPNVYQKNTTGFITVDSIGNRLPDSLLIDKLDKLKDTLSKQQQKE